MIQMIKDEIQFLLSMKVMSGETVSLADSSCSLQEISCAEKRNTSHTLLPYIGQCGCRLISLLQTSSMLASFHAREPGNEANNRWIEDYTCSLEHFCSSTVQLITTNTAYQGFIQRWALAFPPLPPEI